MAAALPYAEPTGNVLGYLWGKEAYGAMLWAGAVSDLSIAETLRRPAYRPLMIMVANEVLAQARVDVESFDGFVPNLKAISTGSSTSICARRQEPQRHLPRPRGAKEKNRDRRDAPRHP